jgi:hypothetical protein
MSEKYSPSEFVNIFSQLTFHQESPEGEKLLDPQLCLLREWQSNRLKHTYSDLIADKRYQRACEFFLNDVYAPRDFSSRDQDAQQLYTVLAKILPEGLLRLLSDVVEMNHLSNALDSSLLHVLQNELGMIDSITSESYTRAYQICDNYDQRKYQIDLLAQLLRKAGRGASLPVAGVTLRLAAIPARQTGWDDLYQFLVRGYHASRPMLNDLDFFITTIQLREMTILDKIFSGDPNPFQAPTAIFSSLPRKNL